MRQHPRLTSTVDAHTRAAIVARGRGKSRRTSLRPPPPPAPPPVHARTLRFSRFMRPAAGRAPLAPARPAAYTVPWQRRADGLPQIIAACLAGTAWVPAVAFTG